MLFHKEDISSIQGTQMSWFLFLFFKQICSVKDLEQELLVSLAKNAWILVTHFKEE